MTIHFEKPQISRNWLGAVMHGVLAAVEATPATGPNVHNIVLQLKEALSALAGKETDTPPNKAWNWAARTLTYAAGDILAQSRRLAPLSTNKEDALKAFFDAATQFDGATFDQATLRTPSLSPAFEPARKALPELLLKATTSKKLELDTLKTRFDRALQAASNRVICENSAYFKPLEDALVSVGGEVARREADWARHNFWITAKFTDEPVFSPDADETVPLAAVYLRLRCFWNEEIAINTDNRERQKIKRTAHVSDLHETLKAWLNGSAGSDPVRVVTGGPGSGKSCFASAFAHELIQDTNKQRVALIRLQYAHLSGQLDQDIAAYFHKYNSLATQNGNPGLPQSPLEWRKEDATPLLLIFDGLDELAADDGEAEKYAREFLLSLTRMLQPLNIDGPPVRAVVLGRNIACVQAIHAAGLPLSTMVNVAPIAPMTRETCLLERDPPNKEEDLFDPENLMKDDQRETYWQQWAEAKGLDKDGIPKPVTHESMSALNLEPLLLHLLIISKYCGENWEKAAANRNLVYEDILEKIFERNKDKGHFAIHNITRDDFFALMEVLGLAAWRGNGRTGNEETFGIVRTLHLGRPKHYRKIAAASLKSVALNIHTRPGGRSDDDGFEFIHKSFGEFLAARGLLSHARNLAGKLAGDEEPDKLAAPWAELIAGAELTPYIIQFLFDEARRTLAPADAGDVKDSLTEMLNWVLEHGFPVTVPFPGLSWRRLETHQRCSESALLAAASAVASVIPIDTEKTNGSPSPTIDIRTDIFADTAIAFITRLIIAPGMAVGAAFSRVNLSRTKLLGANLSGANLSGADLRGTNLSGADLRRADLRGADLRGAKLRRANLSGADLRGTNLSGANLSGANLSGANLSGANLSGADLIEADLRRANLSGANLSGADLSGADLRGANLSGANLSEADLRGAKLSVADLRGADLSGANLSEADLIEADLSGADLSEADLFEADLSEADLRGTNLSGAKLRRADLSEADLRRANLSEADLRRANLSEADLRRADLSEAECNRLSIKSARLHSATLKNAIDLTQEQINSARGNNSTSLPDRLTRPESWIDEPEL